MRHCCLLFWDLNGLCLATSKRQVVACKKEHRHFLLRKMPQIGRWEISSLNCEKGALRWKKKSCLMAHVWKSSGFHFIFYFILFILFFFFQLQLSLCFTSIDFVIDCCGAKRALICSCFWTRQDIKMMLISFCSDKKVLDSDRWR